jgi:MFS transporter, ACDE family, multidrug resistance protein
VSEPAPPPPTTAPVASAAVPPSLVLIFTITVTGILANTLVGPAIPDILDAFDQPDERAGLFVASGTLPGIVMAPVIGLLADRYGRRAVLVPCLTAFGLFGMLSAAAPSFWVLLGLRTLQGVGSAGLINLAVVLIGDHWSGVERARHVGQNAAVLTLSLAVFPPVGGLLTELGGWRLSFAPYAIGLVTAARMWRRLPPSPPASVERLRDQLGQARVAVRQRDVLGSISMGFVLFVLIFGLFLTTLPVHLEREFDLGAGWRGAIIGVPSVTSTFAALRLGHLRARFGAVRLLIAAGALFTAAFVVMGAAASLPVLVVGALVYGAGEGICIPTLQDVVSGAAPASQRGAVVAVWVGAARAGQTVGPLAAGAAYGVIGTGGTFFAGGALATLILVTESIGRFGADP